MKKKVISNWNTIVSFASLLTNLNCITSLASLSMTSSSQSLIRYHENKQLQAAHNGKYQGIHSLLKAVTNIGSVDEDNLTLLRVAAYKGHIKIVKLLLAKKANVGAVDNNGLTPLHYATGGGHTYLVKLFLKNNAPINAVDNNGLTSLHLAAYFGKTAVVKTLIGRDANYNAMDKEGRTPLLLARENNHKEISEMLHKKGAHPGNVSVDTYIPLFHEAANAGYTTLVRMLININTDRNPLDRHGFTPLHWGAGDGHIKIVSMLINAGANAVATTKDDKVTPLHKAARNGHKKVVSLLIKHVGKNAINAIDHHGWTALHLAAHYGHEAIIELLLNAGANKDLQIVDGPSPLHSAISGGHQKAVEMLLDAGAQPDVYALTIALDLNRPTITLILLLSDNVLLKNMLETLKKAPLKHQKIENRLQSWSFDPSTLQDEIVKSTKLLKEKFIQLLSDNFNIPIVIAALIFRYHNCINTRMCFLTSQVEFF